MKLYEIGTYSHEGGRHLLVTSDEDLTQEQLGAKLHVLLLRVASRTKRDDTHRLEDLFDEIQGDDLEAVGLCAVTLNRRVYVNGWGKPGGARDYDDNDLTTQVCRDLAQFDWPEYDWETDLDEDKA